MFKSSTTTQAVWPCMYQAGNSLSATQCVTPMTTYCAPWAGKECDGQTGDNGTTITEWVDFYGESAWFDALYRALTLVYAKTDVKTRPESHS